MLLLWMGHGKNVDALLFLVLCGYCLENRENMAQEVLSKYCMAFRLREDMDLEEWYEGHK